jgi:hypothetical protein
MKKDGLLEVMSGKAEDSELVRLINEVKYVYQTDYVVIEKDKNMTSFYIEKEQYQKIYKLLDTNYNNENRN